jgi:hypothetical protein
MTQTLTKKTKNNHKEEGKDEHIFQLTKPEVDLIMTMRNIAFGEIEGLKIIDRSPLDYVAARKTVKI